MPNQTFLGFDFGTKRIGVAVGQSLTRTASPLKNLSARDGIPDWQLIERLIQQWRPHALIVGIPLNMDGSEQAITHRARRFANRLRQRSKLPVYGIDERLTTVSARSEIFDRGGYKALQKQEIDSFAAKLILESWLNLETGD